MNSLKSQAANKRDHTKDFFNGHCETYQRNIQEFMPKWLTFVGSHYLRFFGALNGCLLDLGSGNTRYYDDEKYERVIFLDYAINMFKSRQRKANSVFLNADASYIPLRDNSVELIFINSCLHHLARNTLKDSDRGLLCCLKECRRVLKKDGRILIFETSIPVGVEKIYKVLFPFLFNLTKLLRKPMVRPLSRTTVLKLIEEASLVIVKEEQAVPKFKVALAGCLLGNDKFLFDPKVYPWKFHFYFLTK